MTREGGAKIRIGISSCLLGERVRYDGGHKHDRFLTDTLGRYVEWVPVCPELEAGLGVPRPAMRLEREGDGVRLVAPATGVDHTARMRRFAHDRVAALAVADLSGYVLKKSSPSCGLERVAVYGGSRAGAVRSGRGLFAERLLEVLPNLPVEEEGRLSDPRLRENWIERVFTYRRLRDLWARRWTIGHLVAFHTAHELALLSHSPKAYRELGRMVAGARGMRRAELRERYESGLMRAMGILATRGRHRNVLEYAAGHLRGRLDTEARAELAGLIEDYAKGLVPLIVPITLLRHHVRRLRIESLSGQVYLDPHPREIGLRNHV